MELYGKYRRKLSSVILFVIDMMNSVHSLPMNLPTDFTDGIYSVGYSVCKNDTSYFFLLCFKFFSHGNSLGISVCIYRFSGSVKKHLDKPIYNLQQSKKIAQKSKINLNLKIFSQANLPFRQGEEKITSW